MKIGILQTGRAPEELRQKHGDYDGMFARLLAADGFEFEAYPVLEGVFPAGPDACDAWVITGSRHGVYEDHPWIPPLEYLLREAYAKDIPIVGICFGHQILAQALGGKVEKFAGGWDVGLTTYEVTNEVGDAETLRLNAWHQDQVVRPPNDARVIGSTDFCKYAALAYGKKALTIQPHPEFNAGYMRDLIEARRDVLPGDVAERGLASVSPETDSTRFAEWVIGFLRSARQEHAQSAI
jgi:GMP synthase (glutamine-hydrolysing)